LDFHSPYGCSKGAADQYVRDYSRIYGLKTIVFRQSCIYGPHQFGVEDQGWLAWFAIAQAQHRSITIYGNGKQVRDVLFVDDLLDCYLSAVERAKAASGHVFNVGGGPTNTLSLTESLAMIAEISGRQVPTAYAAWRPGDQPIYYSDISLARTVLHWEPKIPPAEGLRRLYAWISERNIYSR
jgi:CDP-paratose 2-epimerase